MKRALLISLSAMGCLASVSAQTLEECQQAAAENYPAIRQLDLIAKTTDLSVANIAKGWLPQLSASAQATLQSDVTAWPEQMKTMLAGMGTAVEGLKKDQYRVGLDVQQVLFDGGSMRRQQDVARAQGEVQTAQVETTVYQIRKRVNEMYFGLRLTDEQLRLNADLVELLAANEKKLNTLFEKGTAAESDYLNMKAERLKATQQRATLEAQRRALATMLSTFCGIQIGDGDALRKAAAPEQPGTAETETALCRPELKSFDAQLRLANARERALDAALMPRIGLFAQGWYGYPGLNMFDDMMHHRWSLNGIVGARLTWNVGALYTRRNDKKKIEAQRQMLDAGRETFLLNNRMEQAEQTERIAHYKTLLADDDEIIDLRTAIRRSAESKLAHGIIDVNDLLREINAENAARLGRTVHEIEMEKEINDLKYIKGL